MDDEGMFGECTSIGTTERRLGTSSGAADSAKRPATPLMIPRRAVAALTAAACSLCGLQKVTPAAPPDDVLHLPLQPTVGGVLTAGVLIDGEPFRLIVDTGSPYLVVPLDECASQPPRLSSYGCAEPGQFRASAYPPTLEQYGAGPSAGGSPPGRIEWLTGDVRFGEPELQRAGDGRLSVVVAGRVGGELVFGGADRNVMSQSGGALLGLIREVNRDPRLSIYQVAQLRPSPQAGRQRFAAGAVVERIFRRAAGSADDAGQVEGLRAGRETQCDQRGSNTHRNRGHFDNALCARRSLFCRMDWSTVTLIDEEI